MTTTLIEAIEWASLVGRAVLAARVRAAEVGTLASSKMHQARFECGRMAEFMRRQARELAAEAGEYEAEAERLAALADR